MAWQAVVGRICWLTPAIHRSSLSLPPTLHRYPPTAAPYHDKSAQELEDLLAAAAADLLVASELEAAELAAVESKLAALQERHEALQQRHRSAEAAVAEREAQVGQLQRQLATTAELADAKLAEADKKLQRQAQVANELAAARSKLAATEGRLAKLQQHHAALQQQYQAAQKTAAEWEAAGVRRQVGRWWKAVFDGVRRAEGVGLCVLVRRASAGQAS